MKTPKIKNKQFAIIGLGRFGSTVAKTLFEKGEEVLAIDIKEDAVTAAQDYCTHAVVADVTDERAFRALGIENFDVVIIAIASDLEASVLCTLTCKEIGVKKVIAKAENLKHKMVLERVGADEVVIPEMEMGEKMGARLANPLLHDIMTISSKYSIIEIELPESWEGSSLVALDIRKKYDVNVLAVERGTDVLVNFAADEPLLKGDTLLVGGSKEMLDLLQNQYN
ncbi:MAG: TrkA family potassium uptake protein [Eubacteriales bacterium]|nr:TrkA family potassium uptake protein [Christensenellaceae bacterium]MDY3241195.1 TrkA family potassium uptake protein [Eubacteriales bacterium]